MNEYKIKVERIVNGINEFEALRDCKYFGSGWFITSIKKTRSVKK